MHSNLYAELQARRGSAAAAKQERHMTALIFLFTGGFLLGLALCAYFGISLSDLPTNLG